MKISSARLGCTNLSVARAELSSVPPRFYASRFVDFMMAATDYGTIAEQQLALEEQRERNRQKRLQEYLRKGGDERLFPKEAFI